jgi:hypothetical protein
MAVFVLMPGGWHAGRDFQDFVAATARDLSLR